MKIIYKSEENMLWVIHPSAEWGGTIEELAQKDVPTGLRYKIVEDSVIPTDRTFRNAWDFDFESDNDGVGA